MYENWKDIEGFAGYMISDQGRVKSLKMKSPKIMKPSRNNSGYLRLPLRCGDRYKTKYVHRLVLENWCPRPDAHLVEASHLNHNKDDNRLCNLKWETPNENKRRSVRDGKIPSGEHHYLSKLTWDSVVSIRDMYERGFPCDDIGKAFGVSHATIRDVVTGRTWKNR